MENYYVLLCEPKNIEDSIIRISSFLSLKVLFVIIKYSDSKITTSEISSILKKSIDDIEDSIEFWINLGVIKCEQASANRTNEKQKIIDNANSSYISKRLKSEKEISSLLNKIETLMGRPLSGADVSLFVRLKDFDGLPSKVIIMLVQYCIQMGKKSTRYIEAVGNNWIQEGINSVEDAKKKIKTTNKMHLLWKKFEKIIGSNRMPTTHEKEVIYKWFVTWNYDDKIVQEAYDRCINATGQYKLNYMDGIIKSWKNNNICALDDIDKKIPRKFGYNSTYDISKYERTDFLNLNYLKD